VRRYVGQAAAGQEEQLSTLAGVAVTKRQQCSSFLNYLENNGLHALVDGLQALPHNNAEYIEQYNQLSVSDRELVGDCARLAAEQLISNAWTEMDPEEQAAYNAWVAEKLAEEAAGKPGVAVYCPPGTPPAQCAQKIAKAVDAAECRGGIRVPLGPVDGCIPQPVVIGAVAVLALLIFRR
jgi:hypothetical protein